MATPFLDRRRRLDSASDSDTLPSTDCASPSTSKRSSVQAPSPQPVVSANPTNKFAQFVAALENDKKPTTWGKPRKFVEKRGRYVRKDALQSLNPFAEDFLPVCEYNPEAMEFVRNT